MRFTILVDKDTTVTLARTVEIPSGSHLFVKKAAVYWNYDNVCRGHGNDVLSVKGKKVLLPAGHYTFAGLVRLLDKHDVTLMCNDATMKATIKTVNELKLRGLGPLLGFRVDSILAAGSTTEGHGMIDINNGLRHVDVSCSMVDTDNNFGITGGHSADHDRWNAQGLGDALLRHRVEGSAEQELPPQHALLAERGRWYRAARDLCGDTRIKSTMVSDSGDPLRENYGKDYENAMKKSGDETARLKRAFFAKHPYADRSMFVFQVTVDKSLAVTDRVVFFKVDDSTSYDVTSDTFTSNAMWGRYLAGDYSMGTWPKMWLLLEPPTIPRFSDLVHPNNPTMVHYRDGESRVRDVRFQSPVSLGYEIHDFPIHVPDTRSFGAVLPPMSEDWKMVWGTVNGKRKKVLRTMTYSTNGNIRKVPFDYKTEPYFAMIAAAYVATFLCGISAKHLAYDPDTPKQIKRSMQDTLRGDESR